MGYRFERWRLEPSAPPRVWRRCAGCSELSAFVCSERFRVNAQKKMLDVWLLYRCIACNGAWKHPIVERRRVGDIDPALMLAFQHNAAELARRHAFDIAALRRHAVRVENVGALRVERILEANGAADGDAIAIDARYPCDVRLDRLLASELSTARGRLRERHDAGTLLVTPARRDALSRPVRDGDRVCFIGGFGAPA